MKKTRIFQSIISGFFLAILMLTISPRVVPQVVPRVVVDEQTGVSPEDPFCSGDSKKVCQIYKKRKTDSSPSKPNQVNYEKKFRHSIARHFPERMPLPEFYSVYEKVSSSKDAIQSTQELKGFLNRFNPFYKEAMNAAYQASGLSEKKISHLIQSAAERLARFTHSEVEKKILKSVRFFSPEMLSKKTPQEGYLAASLMLSLCGQQPLGVNAMQVKLPKMNSMDEFFEKSNLPEQRLGEYERVMLFCPGYLVQLPSHEKLEESLQFVLGHELAHTIEESARKPTRAMLDTIWAAQDQKKGAEPQSSDTSRAMADFRLEQALKASGVDEGRIDHGAFMGCLREKWGKKLPSLATQFDEISQLMRTAQDEAKKNFIWRKVDHYRRYLEGYLNQYAYSPSGVDLYASEIRADHFGGVLLANHLESVPFESRRTVVASNLGALFCSPPQSEMESQGWVTQSDLDHPTPDFRVGYILGLPEVRKQLGCSPRKNESNCEI